MAFRIPSYLATRVLACALILQSLCFGLPQTIKIGAIFEEHNVEPLDEIVFKHAVQRVNSDHKILPNSHLNVRLEKIQQKNSLDLADKVCSILRQGVAAIFGPKTDGATLTESICDVFDIPHVETRWNYQQSNKHKINLHPHPHSLSLAYKFLVESWRWDAYVVIYEENYGLIRLEELLQSQLPLGRKILVRKLPIGDDYRPLLKEIMGEDEFHHIIIDCSAGKAQEVLKQAQQVGMMHSSYSYLLTTLDIETMDIEDFKYGEINITAFRLVDSNRPEVKSVVQELNTLINSNNILSSNLNGFSGRPVPGPSYSYDSMHNNASSSVGNVIVPLTTLTTEIALMYDAVYLLAETMHQLDSIQKIDIRSLNCEKDEQWGFGSTIINYVQYAEFQGLTGIIKFDTEGYRSSINLDVVQVTEAGITKIGYWNTNKKGAFDWVRRPTPEPEKRIASTDSDDIPLYKKTLIVTTFLNAPLCMRKISSEIQQGNEQFEGYIVDLVHKLSLALKFKYEIRIVGDNNYGKYNATSGKWNGMIGEVMSGIADIAVADLAINKIRQGAVDFTMPFMNLGISILFTSPKAKPPGLFSFMSPFSFNVWMCMAASLVVVPLVHYIIGRVSPQEWDNPYNCVQNPTVLHNQFTQPNSFWFTVGSIMQQGSDIAPKLSPYERQNRRPTTCLTDNKKPNVYEITTATATTGTTSTLMTCTSVKHNNKLTFSDSIHFCLSSLLMRSTQLFPKAISTRMLAGTWWFFTLIMVSSYTASLATFLIVQDLDESIKSLEDLAAQTKVKYGCMEGGSTADFFKFSPMEDKIRIWENMVKFKSLKKTNDEGIEAVKEGKGLYAFFMESTIIEYNIERQCGLAQVGKLLDNKGYGIAVRKNSTYLPALSSEILHLQEKGILSDLQRKWWKEERKETTCAVASASDNVEALRLVNLGGVFVVLVVGCIVAIFFAFFELFTKSKDVPLNDGDSRWKVILQELRFAITCKGNVKPNLKNKAASIAIATPPMEMGSTSFLDLGITNSYGFPPKPAAIPPNHELIGLNRDNRDNTY